MWDLIPVSSSNWGQMKVGEKISHKPKRISLLQISWAIGKFISPPAKKKKNQHFQEMFLRSLLGIMVRNIKRSCWSFPRGFQSLLVVFHVPRTIWVCKMNKGFHSQRIDSNGRRAFVKSHLLTIYFKGGQHRAMSSRMYSIKGRREAMAWHTDLPDNPGQLRIYACRNKHFSTL